MPRYLSTLPGGDRVSFEVGDVFDFLAATKPGAFDVIMCYGFLYHTVRHVDFFRACRRLAPETVLIDTSAAKNYLWFGRKKFGRPAALFLEIDDPGLDRDTTDEDGIVFWPSASLLETLFKHIGFAPELLSFRDATGDGVQDYKRGTRVAYKAARTRNAGSAAPP